MQRKDSCIANLFEKLLLDSINKKRKHQFMFIQTIGMATINGCFFNWEQLYSLFPRDYELIQACRSVNNQRIEDYNNTKGKKNHSRKSTIQQNRHISHVESDLLEWLGTRLDEYMVLSLESGSKGIIEFVKGLPKLSNSCTFYQDGKNAIVRLDSKVTCYFLSARKMGNNLSFTHINVYSSTRLFEGTLFATENKSVIDLMNEIKFFN